MARSQRHPYHPIESLCSADGLKLVRSVAERMLRELIEAEAATAIGAGWNKHTETRTGYRNGQQDKTLTIQAGDWTWLSPRCTPAASSRPRSSAAAG